MKYLKPILLLTYLLSILSCSQIENNINNDIPLEKNWFNFPKLNLKNDGNTLHIKNQINSHSSVLISSTDTNIISNKSFIRHPFVGCFNMIDSNHKTININIRVDDNITFSTLKPAITELAINSDSIFYDKVVQKGKKVTSFPLYILNNNDSIVLLECHDGEVIMIQEAIDTNGKWRPIENFIYSGCGNSFHDVAIKKNNYALTYVYKYDGDFKTKLRVKLKSHGSTFYSNEFKGKINLSQFNKSSKESFGIKSYLD